MDTITHTLFGLTIYAAVDKQQFTRREKAALFAVSVAGSQIPDIDIVSSMWDTEGRYQMWHRGLTHSIFLVPFWAALLAVLARAAWKVKGWKYFWIGVLAVFIHITSDLFNAWGTGYFEPFSSMRITFGTIPIVDPLIWALMLGGYATTKLIRKLPSYRVFRYVWILIALHVAVQSAQGFLLYHQQADRYDQVALSSGFVPFEFQIIGKKDSVVEISHVIGFGEPKLRTALTSAEEVSLDKLFSENPRAKTLLEWSPFVVIVDDEERIGLYDPRFYRGGQSFLFEFIEKKSLNP